VYLLGVPLEIGEKIVNTLSTHPEVIGHVTISWQGDQLYDVHVTHRAATKEHAIEKWREIVSVDKKELIGFGDSGNDIPIFEAVGLKIAAVTGTEAVLELADYIAPGPAEGGLEHIIAKFLL